LIEELLTEEERADRRAESLLKELQRDSADA